MLTSTIFCFRFRQRNHLRRRFRWFQETGSSFSNRMDKTVETKLEPVLVSLNRIRPRKANCSWVEMSSTKMPQRYLYTVHEESGISSTRTTCTAARSSLLHLISVKLLILLAIQNSLIFLLKKAYHIGFYVC